MLFSRITLFFLVQEVFALLFLLAEKTPAWENGAAWWVARKTSLRVTKAGKATIKTSAPMVFDSSLVRMKVGRATGLERIQAAVPDYNSWMTTLIVPAMIAMVTYINTPRLLVGGVQMSHQQ